MPNSRSVPRLYVLPPSDFCERARWGLDLAGVPYTEHPWAVGLHIPLARRIAPRTTLPILHAGNEVIQGSGRILDWVGLRDGDAAIEARLEGRIGPLVRQFLYAATLGDPKSGVRDMLMTGVSPAQKVLARIMWPALRRAMATGMKAHPRLLPTLQGELDIELNWFERQLAERASLAHWRIGRTHITAASLIAPLVCPEQVPIYRRLVLPPEIGAVLEAWKQRPSLQWVKAIYAHRHARPGAVPRP
jgi:glutathione S-transferase